MKLPILIVILCAFAHQLTANVSFGGPPKGLMIFINSWNQSGVTPAQISDRLNYICANHRYGSGQNQTIKSLLLSEIAYLDPNANVYENPPTANDILAWSYLEAILPFFPGGNGACNFEKVYLGTFAVGDGPDCSMYIDCITRPDYRDSMRLRQKKVVQEFANRVSQSSNPNVQWDWYISQEYAFEYTVYNNQTTNGYAEYISKQMIDFQNIHPNREYVWSPGWYNNPFFYADNDPTLRQILRDFNRLFTQIQQSVKNFIPACQSNATCPFWLLPQDDVGSYSSCGRNTTKEATLRWMNLMRPYYPFQKMSLNVEQFKRNWWANQTGPSTFFAGDCLEVKEREEFYVANGYDVGPSFELRYWWSCHHPGSNPPCPSGWTAFNNFCYKKFRINKTWMEADAYCRSQNSRLASIHTKTENDFVVALDQGPEDSVWIGLSRPFHFYAGKYKEGIVNGSVVFQWADEYAQQSETPMDFINWAVNRPFDIGTDVSCEPNIVASGQRCYPSTDLSEGLKCGAIYPQIEGGQWSNAGCTWQADAFVCKMRLRDI